MNGQHKVLTSDVLVFYLSRSIERYRLEMCVMWEISQHKFPMFKLSVIYKGLLFEVLMLWMHIRVSLPG